MNWASSDTESNVHARKPKAEDTRLHRFVALKFLPPEMALADHTHPAAAQFLEAQSQEIGLARAT